MSRASSIKSGGDRQDGNQGVVLSPRGHPGWRDKTSYPGCVYIKTVGKRCRRKTRVCWEYDSRHPY